MTLLPQFLGGGYRGLSPTFADDTAVNVYLETRQVDKSVKQATLFGTPGLLLESTQATTGNRGWFTQDGRTFTVIGDTLYERIGYGAYTSRGTIANDGAPVSFASNGKGGDQLGIVGAGALYVLDLPTNAFASVSLPFTGPVMITFIDGYGLINEAQTPKVWHSALEDFTSWDALDFFTRSGTSDNIVAIAVSRDRIWCIGSRTTTLFYDSGDVDTPFLPYPGTSTQIGILHPWLLTLYNDSLIWVAESARGQRRVVMATESQPQTISTPPIDRFLSTPPTLADGRMLVYEQEGHPFVAVTAPSATIDIKTMCYDLREQVWHSRAGFDVDTGRYVEWRASGSTSTDGLVLVGDYASGDTYVLDLDTYTDNGQLIKRERVTSYLSQDNQWLFLNSFELGAQVGVGANDGVPESDPHAQLEISRDAGQTWVYAGMGALGKIGAYLTRVLWRRLGRVRSDRLLFRVTQTAAVKCAWIGAWVNADAGTGQL